MLSRQESRIETLQRHLGLIVNACLALQPDSRAIILYGAFGRDEGSWYEDDQGTWRPYNDYDVGIITRRRIPPGVLEDQSEALAARIGIRWVDLGQFHPDRLNRMRPSILNYDLRNGSKVIWGDPGVLRALPEFHPSELPMKEAQTLYFTRLYTFLGSLDGGGLGRDLEGEASRFFRNQMAKAVLAVVDVLLLARGAYHHSYHERVDRVGALYPEKRELVELSRWALQEKLRPDAPRMSAKHVEELYCTVHTHFIEEMHTALSLHFRRPVSGPERVEFCMKWLPLNLSKRLYGVLKSRGSARERQLAIALSQSYLVAAWTPDGIEDRYLERGIELLRQVDRAVPRSITWDQARLEAARLRMEV